jgi:hypothetical protein
MGLNPRGFPAARLHYANTALKSSFGRTDHANALHRDWVVRYLHDQSTTTRTVHVMTRNYLFRKAVENAEGSATNKKQDGEVHGRSLVPLTITTRIANLSHIV